MKYFPLIMVFVYVTPYLHRFMELAGHDSTTLDIIALTFLKVQVR
jgi:hypothetical protein